MRYPQHRHRARTPAPQRNRDREYFMLREAWRIAHPQATPAEYEREMTRIARLLGL